MNYSNSELFTELREELMKAKGEMIYENDIPDMPRKTISPVLVMGEDGTITCNGITIRATSRWKTGYEINGTKIAVTDRVNEYNDRKQVWDALVGKVMNKALVQAFDEGYIDRSFTSKSGTE